MSCENCERALTAAGVIGFRWAEADRQMVESVRELKRDAIGTERKLRREIIWLWIALGLMVGLSLFLAYQLATANGGAA